MNEHTFWFGIWLGLLFPIAGAVTLNYGGPPAMGWTLAVSGFLFLIANMAALYTKRWINRDAERASRH